MYLVISYCVIAKFIKPWAALKANGFRVMILLRLCSIIPFNALNYIGGVTGVTLRDFNLSLVGIIPRFLIDAVIGGTAESLMASDYSLSDIKCWTLLLSCFIGLVALFFIIHLSRVELKKVSFYLVLYIHNHLLEIIDQKIAYLLTQNYDSNIFRFSKISGC